MAKPPRSPRPPLRIIYDQVEVMERICERISNGESLRAICKDQDMPAKKTVMEWLNENEALSDQYARARIAQADHIFEECLDIANTPIMGVEKVIKPDGSEEMREGDMLGHRRLQIDTRKWMAGKLAPKKYGDKLDVTLDATLTVRRTLLDLADD